jgi:hypothetical protein
VPGVHIAFGDPYGSQTSRRPDIPDTRRRAYTRVRCGLTTIRGSRRGICWRSLIWPRAERAPLRALAKGGMTVVIEKAALLEGI